jgi:hypothetical protein
MKKLEEMTQPDFLSTAFATINPADGTSRKMVLADFYKHTETIRVREAAPEPVRTYMEATKTLFVYGWFYYPFFTLSAFMATTAVEMALRLRLQKSRNDQPGLKALFEEAIRQGILRDEGFPSGEAVPESSTGMFGENGEPAETLHSGNGRSYTETVAEVMRSFRNQFAHPSGHWILFPGQAVNFLTLAGEIINQLWPGEASHPANPSESCAWPSLHKGTAEQ